MEESTTIPLVPGSVINVPLGAKLEMQLKLPSDGSNSPIVTSPEADGQMMLHNTTKSRMQSQQSTKLSKVGQHSVSESSQAVQKVMSDARSMVSQSSFESNESQRITKTTAQQQMKYSKQTFSSTSSFESSHH